MYANTLIVRKQSTHPYIRKEREAERLITSCVGRSGIWASPDRYRNQCRTRPFGLGVAEALTLMHREDMARWHLSHLSARQRADGSIPLLYVDEPAPFLAHKVMNSIRNRRLGYMLRNVIKYAFTRDGVERLTPWTADSELLYAFAMANYGRTGHGKPFVDERWDSVKAALDHIEEHLMDDGVMRGGDWRETRKDLAFEALLSNNCLLYRTYDLLGLTEKAVALKRRIESAFWTGSHYRDHTGTDRFDTLGNAFAVLFGLAPKGRYERIFDVAEELRTPYGYRHNDACLHPKSLEEARVMANVGGNGLIYPFVHGFMVLAALKAGKAGLARTEMNKWVRLKGFAECYDPRTGIGYGCTRHALGAALYIKALEALHPTFS